MRGSSPQVLWRHQVLGGLHGGGLMTPEPPGHVNALSLDAHHQLLAGSSLLLARPAYSALIHVCAGLSPFWSGEGPGLPQAHWGSPWAGTCPAPDSHSGSLGTAGGFQEVPGDTKMCQDQGAAPVPSPASAPGPHPHLLRPRLGSHQPSMTLHRPAPLGQPVHSPPSRPLPGRCVPKAPPHQPHLLPLPHSSP